MTGSRTARVASLARILATYGGVCLLIGGVLLSGVAVARFAGAVFPPGSVSPDLGPGAQAAIGVGLIAVSLGLRVAVRRGSAAADRADRRDQDHVTVAAVPWIQPPPPARARAERGRRESGAAGGRAGGGAGLLRWR